jgi:HSP20 family protein
MADDLVNKDQGGRALSRHADPFLSFRTEMDRLFYSFLSAVPALNGIRQGFPAAQGLMPTLDVEETDKEVVVKADLPGIDEKDINLTIQDGILSLRGEKKKRTGERENYHVMERSYGSFQRSIRLPETINEDKVEARFDKGVLTVTPPKRPELVKAQKKIAIRSP